MELEVCQHRIDESTVRSCVTVELALDMSRTSDLEACQAKVISVFFYWVLYLGSSLFFTQF